MSAATPSPARTAASTPPRLLLSNATRQGRSARSSVSVYFGPDRFAGFGASGAASWEGVARASFGLFWVLLFLAVVNSTVAKANACANVSTRAAFALGRIGVFPHAFARLHPRHRSPVTGVAVQFVIAVGAALGLGFGYDPVTAFVLLATVIVTVIIGVYIVVNLACAGYFLRRLSRGVQPRTSSSLPGTGHRGVHTGAADSRGDPGVRLRLGGSAPLSRTRGRSSVSGCSSASLYWWCWCADIRSG